QSDPARGHRQGAAGVSADRRLARFVAGLTLDAIPEAVAGKAALLVIDTLGNGLAAAGEDFGRAALDVAEQLGGRPESALLGRVGRVAAANAVLANATLAHGLDFDDTREDAIVHTGCVAVTTALAVGEAAGASGRALLEALVAAVEVMCRVGLAVPGALHARDSPGPRPCSRASTGCTRRSPAATTPNASTGCWRRWARDGSSPSSRSSPIRAARSRSRTWTARRDCASATGSRPMR